MPTGGVKKVADTNIAADLDFLFATKALDVNGRKLTFRELSVKESDACLDASRNEDGTLNGRTNMRMIIAKSSVEPKITVDDIVKFPNRIYLKIAEFVNDLNSIDDAEEAKSDEEDGAGNA